MKITMAFGRLAIGLTLFVWLSPIVLLAILSLHSTTELVAITPGRLLRSAPHFVNYTFLVNEAGLVSATLNSLVVASLATVVCVGATLPAAYYSAIIARERRPGAFLGWLLSTRMVPPAAVLVPFLVLANMLLLNRSGAGVAMIIGAIQAPVAAWLFRQMLFEIPQSYCEALRLDGASEFGVLRHVVVPLASRSLLAAILLVFVFSWNEYLLTSVLIGDADLKTLPLLAADFVTGYQIEWGPMLACAVLMLLPPVVAAFLLDRSTRSMFAGVAAHGRPE